MADKEATIYIVDVGKSMGSKHQGRQQNDLDWALNYVWDRMTSIMALDRKTTLQGVIALRSDGTSNELGEEESYYNLSVLQPLSQVLLPDLRRLGTELVPSSTDDGDGASQDLRDRLMAQAYANSNLGDRTRNSPD